MRGNYFFSGILVLTAVTAIPVIAWTRKQDEVRPYLNAYDNVQPGMHEAEVEHLFAGTTTHSLYWVSGPEAGTHSYSWEGSDNDVIVRFDGWKEPRLVTEVVRGPRPNPSFLETMPYPRVLGALALSGCSLLLLGQRRGSSLPRA